MERISHYFPTLSTLQVAQFSKLLNLYTIWNNQINVISRKDLDNFYERHVLHSLAIAKVIQFKDTTKIMDIGTGGGFPGIPLAILYPECNFLLVDSIGKKIKVVKEVASSLGLTNVRATHERAENIHEQFDFIISRAVTAMPTFLTWTKNKFLKENKNDFKNYPLQQTASDILGIDFTQIMPKLDPNIPAMKWEKKYVCIAPHASDVMKYWHHPGGWQKIIDYINAQGYEVRMITYEKLGDEKYDKSRKNASQLVFGMFRRMTEQ
mgnify:CR=1 FL=1